MTDLLHGANGSIINARKLPETGLAGRPASMCVWRARGLVVMSAADPPGQAELRL